MTSILAPLVGMHFRPPAKQVLASLPAGARLLLVPEPENPYDAKAIKVLVAAGEIPESQYTTLDGALTGTGTDLQELLDGRHATAVLVDGEPTGRVFLGFVADSDGKLCTSKGFNGNREVGEACAGAWPHEARLAFAPDGTPCVAVDSK